MIEWTIAIDTVLCERITRCTGCGRAAGTGVRFSVWETPTAAIANILCARCTRVDPEGRALIDLMRRRYGAVQNAEEY